MKLTQAKMCEAMGVTVRQYRNYLTGKPIPSDKLIALSELFGCSTDYLLELTEKRAHD